MKIPYFDDFVGLFYPQLCLACGKNLPSDGSKTVICVSCEYHLPKTNFHRRAADNPFVTRFWGRLPLSAAGALYHFGQGTRAQTLIHGLKYEGKREVGLLLGKMYGSDLTESDQFRTIDSIVPVPLHPKREKIRGYNQSDLFAEGLSETMGKPWWKDVLQRKKMADSQTRKGAAERLENVATTFEATDIERLRGKHILLVDDVVTTGATLESCALALMQVPDIQISMATIAFAGA